MLEFALRMERCVPNILMCPHFFADACRATRTKQLSGPGSSSVPPSKLAAIQAQSGSVAGGSIKGDSGSHKDGSGGSSPRSEGARSRGHTHTRDQLNNLMQTLLYPPKIQLLMAHPPLARTADPSHGLAPNGRRTTWSTTLATSASPRPGATPRAAPKAGTTSNSACSPPSPSFSYQHHLFLDVSKRYPTSPRHRRSTRSRTGRSCRRPRCSRSRTCPHSSRWRTPAARAR